MTYHDLAYLHLATIVPAFLLASYLLLSRKGTKHHKSLGKVYVTLMFITSGISLLMPAQVGPALLNHFGYIHLLSIMTICTLPIAFYSARRGNIRRHKSSMTGLYIGGILVAGSFALMPGRLLHSLIFV